jgi:hypothetical protein
VLLTLTVLHAVEAATLATAAAMRKREAMLVIKVSCQTGIKVQDKENGFKRNTIRRLLIHSQYSVSCILIDV